LSEIKNFADKVKLGKDDAGQMVQSESFMNEYDDWTFSKLVNLAIRLISIEEKNLL